MSGAGQLHAKFTFYFGSYLLRKPTKTLKKKLYSKLLLHSQGVMCLQQGYIRLLLLGHCTRHKCDVCCVLCVWVRAGQSLFLRSPARITRSGFLQIPMSIINRGRFHVPKNPSKNQRSVTNTQNLQRIGGCWTQSRRQSGIKTEGFALALARFVWCNRCLIQPLTSHGHWPGKIEDGSEHVGILMLRVYFFFSAGSLA